MVLYNRHFGKLHDFYVIHSLLYRKIIIFAYFSPTFSLEEITWLRSYLRKVGIYITVNSTDRVFRASAKLFQLNGSLSKFTGPVAMLHANINELSKLDLFLKTCNQYCSKILGFTYNSVIYCGSLLMPQDVSYITYIEIEGCKVAIKSLVSVFLTKVFDYVTLMRNIFQTYFTSMFLLINHAHVKSINKTT